MRPFAFATAALAVGWFAPVQTGFAQTQPPAKGRAAPAAQAIPDHKLDAAAVAIAKVADLSRNYQQQIASAPEKDRPRIADEANTALKKAVTDQGLTVEEYNSIVEVAQKDPAVHEKIIQRIPRSDSGATK
jgi:hypothetical protein